jgi:hypothetical protein
VLSFAFCAAFLKASRDTWPPALTKMSKRLVYFKLGMMCLRCIDNPDHAGLAMANLTAVVPNGACVIDGQSEDGFLLQSGLGRVIDPGITYGLSSSRNKSAGESRATFWLTGIPEGGLGH